MDRLRRGDGDRFDLDPVVGPRQRRDGNCRDGGRRVDRPAPLPDLHQGGKVGGVGRVVGKLHHVGGGHAGCCQQRLDIVHRLLALLREILGKLSVRSDTELPGDEQDAAGPSDLRGVGIDRSEAVWHLPDGGGIVRDEVGGGHSSCPLKQKSRQDGGGGERKERGGYRRRPIGC